MMHSDSVVRYDHAACRYDSILPDPDATLKDLLFQLTMAGPSFFIQVSPALIESALHSGLMLSCCILHAEWWRVLQMIHSDSVVRYDSSGLPL